MNCASCVAHVEKAALAVPGVLACRVNLARGRAELNFDPGRTDAEAVAAAVTAAGYPAAADSPGAAAANGEEQRLRRQAREARAWLRRAVVGLALWLPLELVHWLLPLFSTAHTTPATPATPGPSAPDLPPAAALLHHSPAAHALWMAYLGLFTGALALAFVGSGFYRGAFKALRRGTSNMDTLIALGATVAFGYSAVAFGGYLDRPLGGPPRPVLHGSHRPAGPDQPRPLARSPRPPVGRVRHP